MAQLRAIFRFESQSRSEEEEEEGEGKKGPRWGELSDKTPPPTVGPDAPGWEPPVSDLSTIDEFDPYGEDKEEVPFITSADGWPTVGEARKLDELVLPSAGICLSPTRNSKLEISPVSRSDTPAAESKATSPPKRRDKEVEEALKGDTLEGGWPSPKQYMTSVRHIYKLSETDKSHLGNTISITEAEAVVDALERVEAGGDAIDVAGVLDTFSPGGTGKSDKARSSSESPRRLRRGSSSSRSMRMSVFARDASAAFTPSTNYGPGARRLSHSSSVPRIGSPASSSSSTPFSFADTVTAMKRRNTASALQLHKAANEASTSRLSSLRHEAEKKSSTPATLPLSFTPTPTPGAGTGLTPLSRPSPSTSSMRRQMDGFASRSRPPPVDVTPGRGLRFSSLNSPSPTPTPRSPSPTSPTSALAERFNLEPISRPHRPPDSDSDDEEEAKALDLKDIYSEL